MTMNKKNQRPDTSIRAGQIPDIALSYIIILLVNTILAQKPDTYGGFADVKGKKTGFFHTKEIDRRGKLATPYYTSPEKR
jgi:hypothetical protein